MLKKFIALTLTVFLFGYSFCFAIENDDNYGNNNNGADDNIDDVIGWLELVETSNYVITCEGFVLYVDKNTDVNTLKSNFLNPNNIMINTEIVKTGTEVCYNGGTDKLKVVISGDVNCDGNVSVTDILEVNQIVSGKKNLTKNSAEYLAADINNSNSITVVDINNVRSIILQ